MEQQEVIEQVKKQAYISVSEAKKLKKNPIEALTYFREVMDNYAFSLSYVSSSDFKVLRHVIVLFTINLYVRFIDYIIYS
jgi:tRNA 2-selenouridine synthase SelU